MRSTVMVLCVSDDAAVEDGILQSRSSCDEDELNSTDVTEPQTRCWFVNIHT